MGDRTIAIESLKLLVFDLDGVITSEERYWQAARLTVAETIAGESYLGSSDYFGRPFEAATALEEIGENAIGDRFIYEVKRRAINSNWDLTFLAVSLHLLAILSRVELEQWTSLFANRELPLAERLRCLGQLPGVQGEERRSAATIEQFLEKTLALKGAAVLEYARPFGEKLLGADLPELDPNGELWQLCYQTFQAWYEGKKPWVLPREGTVVAPAQIGLVLEQLRAKFALGILTGRPRHEAIAPLESLDLLRYFDPRRIVTYDEILEAEAFLAQRGTRTKLGKPHPFGLYKALCPDEAIATLCAEEFALPHAGQAAYIGDTGSDVLAALAAGCVAVGVLTGFSGRGTKASKYQSLAELGCHIVLDSILELPSWLQLGKCIEKLVGEQFKCLEPKAAGPKKGSGAIRLDKGELPYPPSPQVSQALNQAIASLNRYPEVMGGELRAAIAEYAGVAPEQVVVGNGSDDLIELLLKVLVRPGDEVILPTPTFFVYSLAAQVVGGQPIAVPRLANFDLDLDAIWQRITPRTKVLFLANPNNPTANAIAPETIVQLLERVQCAVVVDECYYEFCGETVVDLIARYPHLIVLRSFSKSFGLAGIRLGYAIAKAAIADYLYRAAQLFATNSLALVAARAALDDLPYIRANIEQILQERSRLAAGLEQLGFCVYPSATNFLFVGTEPVGATSLEIARSLAEQQIFVADFGLKQGLGPYFFRTAVGTPEENRQLLAALSRLPGISLPPS